MKKGFTLVEVLMALTGVVVLTVIATNFLFSILGQKDQAVADSLLTEQIEATATLIATAVRSAETISVADAGRELKLERRGECWLFRWEETEKTLKFGRTVGDDCTAPTAVEGRVTGQKAMVSNGRFELTSVADSSRIVTLMMDVEVYRPLWKSQRHYEQMFVNLVDADGGDDEG